MGVLAVFLALVAPATLLAEDMRTGKLGGLCSVQSRTAIDPASDENTGFFATSHCGGCFTASLAPPPMQASAPRQTRPVQRVAPIDCLADLAALVTGLPFSRGPPAC